MESLDFSYWVDRYVAGETVQDLAKELQVDQSTLTRWLVKLGVKLRSQSERQTKKIPNMSIIASRYVAGESSTTLADDIGVSPTTIAKNLRLMGVEIRQAGQRRIELGSEIEGEIVDRYLAGESPSKLSAVFELCEGDPYRTRKDGTPSPTGICRILIESEIPLRDLSEAGFARWANATGEERTHHAKATAINLAAAREERLIHVAPSENVLREAFTELGIKTFPQKTVGVYNIDLALEAIPIAVEVETGAHLSGYYRCRLIERMKELFHNGWGIVFVMIGTRFHVTRDRASPIVKKITTLFNRTCLDEPLIGQYGVINRNGDRCSGPRYDIDAFPRIPGF